MPADFLTRIIERKVAEVAAARPARPVADLDAEATRQPARRPFIEALSRPGPTGVNIIAEIKRASPSKGVIRADLDPAAQAAAYQRGGAAAISVLTDGPGFSGSPDDLRAARAAVSLPVLRKDFIVSDYQLHETAAMGADAVLLIVRVLSPNQLADYLALSAELGLDALVEVHDEAELETAAAAGATLVGINNRNLSSFETSLETAATMAARLAPGQVPVAESGITGPADIDYLRGAGIFNFLIGESLVRSPDPEAFLRTLAGGAP